MKQEIEGPKYEYVSNGACMVKRKVEKKEIDRDNVPAFDPDYIEPIKGVT